VKAARWRAKVFYYSGKGCLLSHGARGSLDISHGEIEYGQTDTGWEEGSEEEE